MAQHGITARFYYHTIDMSAYAESIALSLKQDMHEHRPLSGTSVIRVPGFKDDSIQIGGSPMDSTLGAFAWARFGESPNRPWAFLPDGDTIGAMGFLGQANNDSQNITAGDDIVRIPISTIAADKTDYGAILHTLTNAGSSPTASVDNAASTSNGGAAYILCTALSGGGTLTVTVEESANDSDWDTLVAMTALSVIGSEVKEVAGTVNRYLRISWVLTGTDPSATFFVAFARR